MWFLVGPVALGFMTYGIVTSHSGWLTPWDLAFAIVLVLMLVGRWFEQRSGTATTFSGEPSTPTDLRRYVQFLPPVGVGVWIAANVLGNHVLV